MLFAELEILAEGWNFCHTCFPGDDWTQVSFYAVKALHVCALIRYSFMTFALRILTSELLHSVFSYLLSVETSKEIEMHLQKIFKPIEPHQHRYHHLCRKTKKCLLIFEPHAGLLKTFNLAAYSNRMSCSYVITECVGQF